MAARLAVLFFWEVMVASPTVVMAQTRLGVGAPRRVAFILGKLGIDGSKINCISNHAGAHAEGAEKLGFLVVNWSGFSEPACLTGRGQGSIVQFGIRKTASGSSATASLLAVPTPLNPEQVPLCRGTSVSGRFLIKILKWT